MPSCIEDLQMLRLIKAFEKITDQDSRRMVLQYVEELLEKERTKVQQIPSDFGLGCAQIFA
ncbi:hypothetical protein CT676_38475 [Bradyrhizobium sp. MOS001]|nr:hypothetical protein CT676_38475 [Bradyrhizobium sp. MOS001]